MRQVYIRCYAELNDCLPVTRRQRTFALDLPAPIALEELLRSIGIPLDAVDLALINGRSRGLNHVVRQGDHLALFPVFETFDISSLTSIRDRPLRRPRFVLDVHLGKLASLLRLFGVDAVYRNDATNDVLVRISVDEERALLSRNPAFARHPLLTRFFLLRTTDPHRQLLDVLRRFDLVGLAEPFSRCIECNSSLQPVAKAEIESRLPLKVCTQYGEFLICRTCDRIYWKGSHYQRMRAYVEAVLGELREGTVGLKMED